MKALRLTAMALALTAGSTLAGAQSASLNLLCSVNTEWCDAIAASYGRSAGVKVNVLKRSTGEGLAQLMAERANPKIDVWFGGTGDPHMQAAELDLTLEYKSPHLPKLHDWARQQAEQSGWRTVGVYMSPLGFGFNTELLAKKKLTAPKCWKDMAEPQFKGEVQVANPNSSGTAYTMIATLVQLMGEDKAFDYMKALHRNVSQYTRSGVGPIKAVARGESTTSISFVHDAVPDQMQGFPVATSTPCEGTGFELGSMSLVKGARNAEQAKKFYDWALTPEAQKVGAAAKQFQMPSNQATPLDSRIPDFRKIKFIDYDHAKYGKAAERRRLIERWEQDVNSQAR